MKTHTTGIRLAKTDLPKTLEDISALDACAKDMGDTIKHTNFANTGTQFTIQDASNFECSTFKEVSAKLQSWMYSNDPYFYYNAETTCEQ